MIAIESFKKFRAEDVIAILIFACIWWVLSFIFNKFLGSQFSYIFSLLLATTLMSFVVHLVRKAGSATLFYLISGFLTYNINNFGAIGLDKIIIFLIAGLIFELFFIIFKLEFKNVQFDIVIATSFSSMSIPVSIGFLISFGTAVHLLGATINLMILSFLIGLIGSIISFLIWSYLRRTKLILMYEYMP